MTFLGVFSPGDSVKYRANFHTDQGTLVDPTGAASRLETPAGAFSDLTAPSKINSKTGHYGGEIDTTGFSDGLYVVRVSGTVATGKSVASSMAFQVES